MAELPGGLPHLQRRRAPRGVFAVWATTWFTFGTPPYLELPAIGWDTYQRSGRGYPQGRVRGENQIYLEGEYRVTLSPDGFWGAAGFVNLLSTSDLRRAPSRR